MRAAIPCAPAPGTSDSSRDRRPLLDPYPRSKRGPARKRVARLGLSLVPQVGGGGAGRLRQAEMAIAGNGGHAPALRALQVALLDQVRLEHVLDGVALLADRRGQV